MSKQSVRSATTLAAFVFATFLLSASANDRVWILDPTFHLNRLSTQYVPTFYPSYGLVNSIGSVALQADGKIIVAGGVVSDNGAYRAFARLLPNGEVDPDFQPGRNLAAVSALAVNSQQNIYTVNKTDDFVQSISQYDPTGQSLWSHQLSPRGDFREALLALPDGSILVGGSFTNVGDIQRKYIALISETGVVQTSFAPELNGAVLTLSRQQDGKILVGGTFTSINGFARVRIARLMPDGQLDESFDAGDLLTAEPTAVASLSDGKILVSGNFNRRNGSMRDRLLRMNADGSFDASFMAELDEPAFQLATDSQNRIVLAGAFNKINDMPRSRIARLLTDGAVDTSFDPGIGPNNVVSALAIDSNGNYVIGGNFPKVGRRTVNGLARILPSSSTIAVDFADEVFSAGEQYREAVVQLMRYGPTDGELTVEVWTEPGDDPELAEFKPFSTEVQFAPSDLDKTVIIPFPDDGEVEFTERIPIHCRIIGDDHFNTSEISVIDDEQPVVSTGTLPMPPGYVFGLADGSQRAVGNGRIAFSGYIDTEAAQYGPSFYGVAVLNLDGTPTTFSPASVQTMEWGRVETLLWTTDDKLLVYGGFSSINGIPRAYAARLNLDGSLDNTFNMPSSVSPLAALPDGKILGFSSNSGSSTNPFALVRLNSDGAIDPTFHAILPTSEVSQAIAVADGKILLNINGFGIRRLLADGAVDPTFNPPRPFQFDHFTYYSYPAIQIFPQPNGKVLVQGPFTEVDGFRRRGLARLNSDGSLDLNFQIPFTSVSSVFALPDGRFFVNQQYSSPPQLLSADGVPTGESILPGVHLFASIDDRRILDNALHIVPLNNRKLSSVSFETPKITLAEGSPPQEIKVKRIGDLSQTLTVSLSSQLVKGDGADDILVTPSTLTFAPMQTESAFQVQALADDLIEIDEHFKIQTSAPSDLFVPTQLDVVIQDQNGRPGSVRFLADSSNVSFDGFFPLDDGTILIGGWTDSPLTIYNPLTGATNVLSLKIAEDRHFGFARASIPGGFLVAGPFLGPTNAPTNVVFRFSSDGTRDTNFLSPALSLYPRQILPEPAGTFLVTGNGAAYTMARLNADGSIKRIYQLEFDPESAFLIPTNRLLYSSFYGLSCVDLATGRVAAGFTRLQIDGGIEDMVVGGNYFYISGLFTNVNGARRPYLARLTLNGQLDPTYHPVLDGPPRALFVDSKNRLVLFGFFTKVNGVSRISAARLNPGGSLDMSFDPDVFLHALGGGIILSGRSITELPNGDLFALPFFANTSNSYRAVIITSDLPLRANLASNTSGAFDLRLTTLPQKNYVIETSSNLADWQSLVTTNANGYQVTVPLPPNQSRLFVRAQNPN